MDDCQESVLLHHYYHHEVESYQDRSLLHHYQSLGYSFDAGVYCDRRFHLLQRLGLLVLDLLPELELPALELLALGLPAVARRILESPRKVKK
jgi:hypothetical protein